MDKKSPKGRKRSLKTGSGTGASGSAENSEENFWDCSVCTFRNNAEAFKCSMCDVRKGTSTRKPRINPDLVAAQHAQALTPPPPLGSTPTPSSSGLGYKDDFDDDDDLDEVDDPDDDDAEEPTPPKQAKKGKDKKVKTPKETKKNTNLNKARLKNVDRSSPMYHSITVNDITVVITEFKPKVKKERKPKVGGGKAGPSSANADGTGDAKKASNGEAKEEESTTKSETLNGKTSVPPPPNAN